MSAISNSPPTSQKRIRLHAPFHNLTVSFPAHTSPVEDSLCHRNLLAWRDLKWLHYFPSTRARPPLLLPSYTSEGLAHRRDDTNATATSFSARRNRNRSNNSEPLRVHA